MTRVNLITGGAGFIGSNLAHQLLRSGESVILYDNLSRKNVEKNCDWLLSGFPRRTELVVADVRDRRKLRECVQRADAVFHLAAQVAVTTSLGQPEEDFEVNAGGTLNVLEAVRASGKTPPVFYTSTNKVYGELCDISGQADERRRHGEPGSFRGAAVDEQRPLDFHSPYGCSKGTADQYVHDYARSYGLNTVVFRMSCIYGPRQFGNEDQGWIAHFLIRALKGEPITIYGDGHQVRDVLFVSDLVQAFLRARDRLANTSGEVFNMGGGSENTLDLLEVVAMARELAGAPLAINFAPTRIGDQRYYVSDTSKFQRHTGWRPEVPALDGVRRLWHWLRSEGARTSRDLAPAAYLEAT